MRRVVVAGLLGLAVCASAHAQDARRPATEALLGGIVQERDVALVFDYLRDVVTAAAEGREAAPPVELTERAEAIGQEVKRHGAAAARALIDAVESALREGMREPRPPLTHSPYQRI
jgi:hypothetical protein